MLLGPKWPRLGGDMFCISLYGENMKNSSWPKALIFSMYKGESFQDYS